VLLIPVWLYACPLCAQSTPSVHVSLEEQHSDKQLHLRIVWLFSKEFTAQTLLRYKEQKDQATILPDIKQTLIGYLEKENYLTTLKYIASPRHYNREPFLSFDILSSELQLVDHQLRFTYRLKSDYAYQKGYGLYIKFDDKSSFFSFVIDDVKPQEGETKSRIFIRNNSAIFSLSESATGLFSQKQGEQSFTLLGYLAKQLEAIKTLILSLLEDIKEKDSLSAYIWLILFSFLYGIIHALGPGHGKSLVAAYFIGEDRSTFKALNIAMLIGVVHTFSAFVLTFVLTHILNAYLSSYFSDIEKATTQVSALFIIAIALYLLYKKLPKKHNKRVTWSRANPNAHANSCACSACNTASTDLGVILSAGIIPCPGTVAIFVFTLSLGIYWVGFLSAIFMSLGMSLIIFLAAYLSLKARAVTTSSRLRKLLDVGSLLFILMLGLVLLFF
jgi:ABC-type nickel/cobalt efflux system permease component RcnA/ABC-type uncharacterized transport system substrate-binding protein